MNRRLLLSALLCLAGSFNSERVLADAIVTEWQLSASASQGVVPGDVDLDSSAFPALPLMLNQSAAMGGSTSANSYEMTNCGMSCNMDHARDPQAGSEARSAGIYEFTVDAPSAYTLAGGYYLVGSDRIDFMARLVDQTDNVVLFNASFESNQTTNQWFTLGGPLGDNPAIPTTGSLTGAVVPGHQYRLDYETKILTLAGEGSGASSTGRLSLDLGCQPVPTHSHTWGQLKLLYR